MGGTKSHEYHLVSEVGEDILAECKHCKELYNQEILQMAEENNAVKALGNRNNVSLAENQIHTCPSCGSSEFTYQNSIEVC